MPSSCPKNDIESIETNDIAFNTLTEYMLSNVSSCNFTDSTLLILLGVNVNMSIE